MEINLDELLVELGALQVNLDEAKNLCFNGKIVQCDRKIQGCQVRCKNIIQYIASIRVNANAVVDEKDDSSEE